YHFTTNPERYRRFWQGPIMYYNNIWNVPAPLRLPHAIAGLNHLGRLSRTLLRNVFPQSTYSLSLRMAHEVDYWDPDIIRSEERRVGKERRTRRSASHYGSIEDTHC